MASNDGSRLTVFGLTFRQHDNRHMQQILRQYGRLPSNPGNRAALYTSLFDLSRGLDDNEAQGIEEWLQNGGIPDDFPVPRPATPAAVQEEDPIEVNEHVQDRDSEDGDEDEGEWPEYHPEDFENGDIEMDDEHSQEVVEESHFDETAEDEDRLQQEMNDILPENVPIQGNTMDVGAHGWHDDVSDEDEDEAPPRPENECQICTMEVDSKDLFAPTNITSTCKHDVRTQVCLDCVQQHIHEKIQSGSLSQLNCLWCDEELSSEEVKKYALPADFVRYEYLILVSHPDTVMCLSPTCGSGQSHTDTANPKMICNTCTFATCASHKVPWHEGQTCEDFDCNDEQIERLEQAELTARLLTKDQSKICPSCKQGVTRSEGCDHLTCNCGKAWCFLCLASWDNIMRIGGEAHAPTCPSHPRYRPKTKAELQAGQAQFAENLLGGRASEALLRAWDARNERIRADMRPKALEAAEARMRAERERAREEDHKESHETKKRKTKLLPAWEER